MQRQNITFFVALLWLTTAASAFTADGSITPNQNPVSPSLPSPFPPYPPPYPPSLPPCPSPVLPPPPPPLVPNAPPVPSNPPPFPPNPPPPFPPNPPPLPPNTPPLPPNTPVSLPPPPPAPLAPQPSPPNVMCFAGLLTCKNTNISDPGTVCCDNLKIVYEKDENCICTVLESPDLSKVLGLNATDISNLLVECKIVDAPVNLCNSVPAPAPSTPKLSPPPPPNKAHMMTKQVWMTTFFSIFLCFYYFML